MLKQFLKDSAIYGVSSILSRGVALLLLPFYTRVFAPADYGVIDLMTVVTALVNLTVALEISQGLARHYGEAETQEHKQAYASTSLWFTVAAYGVFAVAAFLAAEPLSAWVLNSAAHAGTFRVAVLSMVTSGLFYLLQNLLRWQLRARHYAVSSLAFTFVSAATSVGLVLAGVGITGVFWGLVAGGVVGIALAAGAARDALAFKFDLARCREMLKFSLPLVPSSVAVFATLYIDRIALKALMTLTEVGLFGLGYRLASTVGLALAGVQSSVTPLVYQHYKEPGTPAQIGRIFRVFLAGILPVWIVLAVFAPEIVRHFASEAYAGAAPLVPALALVFLFSNLYLFAPGLTLAKKTGRIALLNGTAAATNTALNFILIPRMGLMGAAAASLATGAIAFALHVRWSQREYPIPYDWGRVVTAAAGCAVGVSGASTLTWVLMPGPALLAAKAAVCLGAGALVVWLLVPADAIAGLMRRLGRRAHHS